MKEKIENSLGRLLSEKNFSRLLLLVLGLYCIRYLPVFAERTLMWDDFEHLIHNSTWAGFLEYVLGSKLHFIPMLHVAYWALEKYVPLPWLPAATSFWILGWVAWYIWVYLRLTKLLDILRVPALFGLSYILLNPMFSESQVWFCVAFYLSGLVVTLEAAVQFLQAIRGGKPRHYVLAVLFAALAPCFWTLGYLTGPLFLLLLTLEKSWGRSKLGAALAVFVAFSLYPALRIWGQFVASHEYGLTPADPFTALKMTLKMIPDGLILGAMGFWFRLEAAYKFTPHYLNFLFGIFAIFLYWLWNVQKNKKAFWFSLFFIFLGTAVPLWGRGNQFAYEVLRYALRYYTFPIFGMGLLVALFVDYCFRSNKTWIPWVVLLWIVFIAGAFSTKNPEHYMSAGLVDGKIRKLRSLQVAQLTFLDEVFAIARKNGVSAKDLKETYYFPVNGGDFHNGMGMYSGVPKEEERPLSAETKIEIEEKLKNCEIWKTYQTIMPGTFPPENIFSSLPPKSMVSMVSGQDLSHAVNIISPSGQNLSKLPRTLKTTGGKVVFGFPIGANKMESLVLDMEVLGVTQYDMKLSVRYEDRNIQSPSANVSCLKSRCRLVVPVQRLSWFPKLPARDAIVSLEIPEGTQIKIHSFSFEPST